MRRDCVDAVALDASEHVKGTAVVGAPNPAFLVITVIAEGICEQVAIRAAIAQVLVDGDPELGKFQGRDIGLVSAVHAYLDTAIACDLVHVPAAITVVQRAIARIARIVDRLVDRVACAPNAGRVVHAE